MPPPLCVQLACALTEAEAESDSVPPSAVQGMSAVSYTHLDVYKRQDEIRFDRLRDIFAGTWVEEYKDQIVEW